MQGRLFGRLKGSENLLSGRLVHSFACNSLGVGQFVAAIFRHLFGRGKGSAQFKRVLECHFGVDAQQIFLVGSGRMGLYIFLKAMGLQKGDEILLPGYTCVVVPNAAKYLDLTVKYVDISQDTLNLDTGRLLSSITSNTKAVIISHNFGIPYPDVDIVKKQYPHVLIIEDVAHAFGAVDNHGAKVGLAGDASFFSFEYSKSITTGVGGALLVNNPALTSRVNEEFNLIKRTHSRWNQFQILITLAVHLLTSLRPAVAFKRILAGGLRLLGLLYQTGGVEISGGMPPDYPVRLADSLASIGVPQVRSVEVINRQKQRVAALYHEILMGVPHVTDFYNKDYIYVRYPLLLGENVDIAVLARIKERARYEIGLILGEWFNDVIHPKGSFRYGYSSGECPVGESVAARIINLPVGIHSPLTREEVFILRKILVEEVGRR